ncbi:hypothetical protein JCM14036_26420 [Desulfotomaculum defluvii]
MFYFFQVHADAIFFLYGIVVLILTLLTITLLVIAKKRKQVEEKITYLAYYDTLTDLPNRLKFRERLMEKLIKQEGSKKTLAVMFLDLDRFKNVNDSLGHHMGDQLLKEVALRLQNCVCQNDLVARLGGDEFTILAQVQDAAQAATLASRVLQQIQTPFMLGGTEINISTSIGITLSPQDGGDIEELLKNADAAMYRAKELGRSTYQFFTSEMKDHALKQMQLEQGLRQGLEQRQFMIYYQPQYDIVTGQMYAVEALLRWQHPQFGFLLPSEFIPLAEETGFIVPLGEWVLQEACAQNKAWQDAGLPVIRVAVNMSARQLLQGDLSHRVACILAETGLQPENLELEITESVAIRSLNCTLEVLQELRALGVHISIDDFGKGFCAFNYLKHLQPIDTLKIGREFMKDISETTETWDSAVVASLINLAKKLRLKVIVEGVETFEQYDFLKMQQSDGVQGFLFCQPIPAEDFPRFLLSQKDRALTHSS